LNYSVTPPFIVSSYYFPNAVGIEMAAYPEVQGSIPGAATVSEYQWFCSGVYSALVTINEELLERKSSGSGLENSV
jgi:hypothetical protein